MGNLDDPLRGVLGAKTAKVLSDSLDLHTVADMLGHYPRRYARRGELSDLSTLVEGEQVTIVAQVVEARKRTMRQRRGSFLEVAVTDGTGLITLTFFGRVVDHHARQLVPGKRGLFAGKVSSYRGKRQLAHPDYELVPDMEDASPEQARAFAEELIPVYPATAKLPSWKVARCVGIVLDHVGDVPDPLPEAVRRRHDLIPLAAALEGIHRPREDRDIARGRHRLKWDEAFLMQVALARRRQESQALPSRAWKGSPGRLLDAFDARLPFDLTDGQREVGESVAEGLDSAHPMHTLLQGDVGSGKTVVALRAMLRVVDSGGQAALLAPTEVLAQQHHRSIIQLMGPLAAGGRLDQAEHATSVALVTGSQSTKERRRALSDAASGAAGIVVGTHALLQENVSFAELGLVVVDEQHRFGVEQRDALRAKGADGRPHVLVMTATPIPRTVAMTVYGDLDVLALSQLPAGRAGITTHVVPAAERPHYLRRAWERVREEVGRGRQAFMVCPRIGDEDPTDQEPAPPTPEDEENPAESERRPPIGVVDLAAELMAGPLSDLRVAILHGRLSAEEKESVMRDFTAGAIDVLVATTVIEVGVDVPRASTMVIMDADRFGVSQLHQLRGRVGRGTEPGLCLLVTEFAEGTPARERLAAVASTTDGFELSRVDLEQRREGDVLGDAQSGRRSTVRLLALTRDEELIRHARDEATVLVAEDPTLTGYPDLNAALDRQLADTQADFLEKT
ncbi:ATP-dependent DNA helicase RecG [Spiractinospora alimapuensis]|uniref:ATP-dependent DNA helicase RecG n=1 Tax=Spiractinospora alimapuensis TaxID=2820884 RepID=UPI001EEC0CDC|nr:ATP-dependent DNA helicase RecG [Spiractinospora alimapuensis]QVQ51659.1 ATP-dependent DNA helicase RecG [Spiractinospora alimapuensis]